MLKNSALLACLALHLASTANAAERPNVVFFLVDDLGYMDIGANNPQSLYETPNVDRLAASGMRFTDGYAANPVCSPTRYSIMTGRYPTRAGATNWFSGMREGRFRPAPLNDRMALEEVTLAEALRGAGYRTFFAGKWHLGPTEEYWPEAQGFEVNRGGWSRGGPYGPGQYFPPYGNPRLADGPEGEHLPDRLATETVRFIEDHRDEPFFAYLSFYSVHTPLVGRPDLVAKYEEKIRTLGLADTDELADEEQVWPTDEPRTVRVLQKHAVYAAMVEAMDQAVGRVLDRLESLGLAEKTVIVFMSDNGGLSTAEGSPTSNLPLRGGKGWLYEGGIREPLLIRAPGATRAGSVSHAPVISTDFYPTILDLVGLPARPEQHRDGVSLLPLLEGAESLPREALFWHYPHYSNQGGFPGAAVRMGPWKLVERFEDGQVHLFNLEDDIGERRDVAGAQPERVAAMKGQLHRWYDEVGAQFLRPREEGPAPWRPEGRGAPARVAGPERIADDLEVTRLAEGVWLHRSWQEMPEYGRVPANGLVVVSDGEAALLDTPWTDEQTRALAGWVRTRLDSQLTTVVPTHSHADCMGGLGAAHQLGARSYALDTTVRFARRDGLPVPEEGFAGELDIPLGSRTLEARFVGAGHTVDTVVVWLPDARILFGGDLVRSAASRALGFTGEADLRAWPASVDALERAYGDAGVVVPGHGAPGGPELFRHTRELLAEAGPR
jgi:arylsulfatase A-like enzyme/glyoxylase-like metal-dependent hydrolase (beta-lactamase superfamily II)